MPAKWVSKRFFSDAFKVWNEVSPSRRYSNMLTLKIFERFCSRADLFLRESSISEDVLNALNLLHARSKTSKSIKFEACNGTIVLSIAVLF